MQTLEPALEDESIFYAPPLQEFFIKTEKEGGFKEAPINSFYILEKKGDYLRYYGKAGHTSEWYFEGDGCNEEDGLQAMKMAIMGGLYRHIPFPASFSSSGLDRLP